MEARRKVITAWRRHLPGQAAREIMSTGFFVPAYYAAQARIPFAHGHDAAAHYLAEGWKLGLLPNPIHDFDGHPLPGPDDVRGQGFGRWTSNLPVRPSVDAVTHARHFPEAREHPGGVAGHFLETVTRDGPALLLRSELGDVLSWDELLEISTARGEELDSIVRSELFDQELYEAQTHLTFASATAAVWHYLERGESAGHSPTMTFHPAPKATRTPASTFARAVKRDRVRAVRGDAVAVRHVVLEQARHDAATAALAQGVRPTVDAWRRFAQDEPDRPSERGISIVVRATQLLPDSNRGAASIRRQTHAGWELLVLLDAAADTTTQARASRLAATDSRIRIVPIADRHDATTALELASGDVLALWDGAETWSPRFLELGLAELQDADVVACVVGHDMTFHDPDPHGHFDAELGTLERLAWSRPRGLRGVLAVRDVWRTGSDPSAGLASQWEWLLNAVKHGRIGFAPHLGVVGPTPPMPDTAVIAEIRGRWLPTVRADRIPGAVSILIPNLTDPDGAAITIRSAADLGMQVVAVIDDRRVALQIVARLEARTGVRIVTIPSPTTWGHAAEIAAAHATGDVCVFLPHRTKLQPDSCSRLVERLRADVVGATGVLVSRDSTIRSAGLVFPGRRALPYRLLAGHPIEDLPALDDVDFAAAESDGLALRTTVIDELGFSPALDEPWAAIDLTLRATATGSKIRTVTGVTFIRADSERAGFDPSSAPLGARLLSECPVSADLVSESGLTLVGVTTGEHLASTPVLIRPRRLVAEGPARGLPSLRWALKLPMPSGPSGDVWGDTYFAADLARALRRLGQEVVLDRRSSHHRPRSSHLDDVVLNLRGLVPYSPQPGTTSIVWVISHPGAITPDELDDSVDLAYAASTTWAAEATTRLGRRVKPLLQATDRQRFNPDVEPDPHGIVFVGRPRNGERPIVRDAIAAGHDLEVYGTGWDDLLDPVHVRADFLPNELLPQVYRGARIVLNDHHADMAAHGFWSNRTFDATACGARVVSDQVAGDAGLFGGLVRTYSTVAELAVLLSPDEPGWPNDDERLDMARRIAEAHSFDARARTMLADVLELRGVEHQLGEH